MATWQEFEDADPAFAPKVRALFAAHRHHTMATVRADGSPRLSGTEVEFEDGELWFGVMAGARRVADLRRDPRLALHSQGSDPPDESGEGWTGEAKVSGRAEEVPSGAEDGSHRFRVVITDVVVTRLGNPADHLVVEHWSEGRGYVQHRR